MSVVHLSTSLHGGAGIAAYRLHKALVKSNFNSKMIALSGPLEAEHDSSIHIVKRSHSERGISGAVTFIQGNLIQRGSELVTPISMNVLKEFRDELRACKVLHLHNLYNLTNIEEIAESFGRAKKIVITLHDQRHLTGGCHYAGSCNQYLSEGCRSCPQVRRPFKKVIESSFVSARDAFLKISDLSLVSPSEWLLERARKSLIARNFQHFLIRNPVDENFFAKPEIKRPLLDKKSIAFISLDLWNPYKGLDVYLDALRRISDPSWFYDKKLLFLGRGAIRGIPKEVEYEQLLIDNSQALRDTLLNTDLVVIPSKEDNFPNVIAESLLSGCDLVTSDSGGVSELSGTFGHQVFSSGNSESLKSILISHQFESDRRDWRATKAREFFSSERIAMAYKEIYFN